MRLLKINSEGELELTKDLPKSPASYAILSHTWGADDEEVTLDDIVNGTGRDKLGYKKLWFCARQAVEDELHYFWVDSCCINRMSSAELSEAINSMFRWYQEADRCYVYLSDVSTGGDSQQKIMRRTWENMFRTSRWFTRGWTLQELLAPGQVEFFSVEGQLLGTKQTLEGLIHHITSIPVEALRGKPLSTFTVKERLRWTAGRETKREEDTAYCLLGIFGVSLTPRYGVGETVATEQLQEKIKKQQKRQATTSISTFMATYPGRSNGVRFSPWRRIEQYLPFWGLVISFMLAIISLMTVTLDVQSVIYKNNKFNEIPSYYQESKLDSRLPVYAVLGVTGVGKSSFIAAVGGKHVETGDAPSIGHQLESHTDTNDFYFFDSAITGPGYLIDTPGIDESNRTRTDTEIMMTIENSLKEVQFRDKLLMGLIFLYDIHQPRAYGSILNALDTTLDIMERLLGTNGIAKTTLVTTRWTEGASHKKRAEEEERERTLRLSYWQGPLSCNSEMARFYNTQVSALNIIARLKERERPIVRPENGCRTITEEPIQKPALPDSQASDKQQAPSQESKLWRATKIILAILVAIGIGLALQSSHSHSLRNPVTQMRLN